MPLRLFHLGGGDDAPQRPEPSASRLLAASPRILRLLGQNAAAAADEFDADPRDHAAAYERLRKVRGVVFEMDDVLYDATAWRRRLWQLLARLGLQAQYRCLFELWDRDFLDAVQRGDRDYDDAFVAFLREAGLASSQVDEVRVAWPTSKQRLEAELRPFPLVRETLERLHGRGLLLAVLCDSDLSGEKVRARLDGLGLGPFFREVVSSLDLRHTKPDPLGYRTCLERLQIAACDAAFVGRDADDLQGAHRCGLTTLALQSERGTGCDVRLRRFDELREFFRGDSPSDTQRRAA
jgi:phosphoglycolate phosphatase-like HAD superfamily hydrolase